MQRCQPVVNQEDKVTVKSIEISYINKKKKEKERLKRKKLIKNLTERILKEDVVETSRTTTG